MDISSGVARSRAAFHAFGLLVLATAAPSAIAQSINTVAGGGASLADGIPAIQASMDPRSTAVDAQGNLYIADVASGRIRKVATDGTITTFAGGGSNPAVEGGAATSALLEEPMGLAFDASGQLYFAERSKHVIRLVTPAGILWKVAGDGYKDPVTGAGRYSGEGPASSTSLNYPSAVAIDKYGYIYIADRDNHRIRRIIGSTMNTFAGNGVAGFSGDGNMVGQAQVNAPEGVSATPDGEILIADTGNNRIRKAMSNQTIWTWGGGDGAAFQLSHPTSAFSGTDNVTYIADTGNHRILRLPQSSMGSVYAGNGSAGFAGDGGPATDAVLGQPVGLSYGVGGAIYFADEGNGRVRKIATGTLSAPRNVVAYAGDWEVLVTYDQPLDDGGQAITAYTVTCSCGITATSYDPANRQQIVSGLALANGGTYTFTVAAINGAGTGLSSAPSNAVTPAPVAAAPRMSSARPTIQKTVFVSFMPSWNAADKGVTGYTVYSSPAGGVDASAGSLALEHEVTGLTPGVAYTFRVRATNPAGLSTPSSASAPVIPGLVPGPPGAVTAVAYGTTIQVGWTDPTTPGNSPVSGWEVTLNPGNIKNEVLWYNYSTSFPNLQPGTSYIATVRALTDTGAGDPKDSNAVVPKVPPGPPIIGSAVLSGFDALVSFSAPASDGGAPITGYTAGNSSYSLTDLDAGSLLLTHRVTGLPAGVPLQFSVYATNSEGNGVASSLSNAVTAPAKLSVLDATVVEGTSGTRDVRVDVVLAAPSATLVSFDIATSDGTATAGSDYTAVSLQSQTFPAGTQQKSFYIHITGDQATEGTESFKVTVSNLSGAVAVRPQATVTITEPPTVTVGDVSVQETNSGTTYASFRVSLSAASDDWIWYSYTTGGGTAKAGPAAGTGVDYRFNAKNGMGIAPGQTYVDVVVAIFGDTTPEADETFELKLFDLHGAAVADAVGVATISNDDGSPTLSIGDVRLVEGNSGTRTATFSVTLSSPLTVPVSFDAATADWNGLAGSDYVGKAQAGLTIPAGQTSASFDVTVNGDSTVEPDELFVVDISNASGAPIADGRAFATIANDDPTVTVQNASTAEGNGGTKAMTFTVALSQVTAVPVTLTYHTVGGGSADASDFVAVGSGSVQVPAGALSASFDILVNGDVVPEPNENLFVSLDTATNAFIGNEMQPLGYVVKGTINNDDAAAISAARIDARGLYDDLDDGRREPVLGTGEYALLLHDVARQVCERAQSATVVGVDQVEGLAVLRELADTANRLCPGKPRYQAVMAAAKGEGTGFLVEAIDEKDVLGVDVIGKPRTDAAAKLSRLTVQGSGHAGPTTVLLPQGLSTRPLERAQQLKALGQRVQAELKSNPGARLVLIGNVTVPGLVDLTARSLPPKSPLPAERVLVSPALLREFEAARVVFPTMRAKQKPAQVLQLQR